MGEVRFIPARGDVLYLGNQMFANLVCMIPPGKVSSSEAICAMWAKRHHREVCQLSHDGILPISKKILFENKGVARVDFITDLYLQPGNAEDDLIPYYRLVSTRGYLIDFGHYSSKEFAAEKLAQEGHTILPGQGGSRSYRLQDYKKVLFDWDRVII